MNCDAIVSKGYVPWLPSAHAEDLEVLHMHEFPLIGLLSVRADTLLYACITGATSDTNMWAYVPIDMSDAKNLLRSDFRSTADLERAVHALFVGRKAAFAMAFRGKVKEWTSDDVDDAGVTAATIRFMDLIIARREAKKSSQTDAPRRAEQGRADVTREQLEMV